MPKNPPRKRKRASPFYQGLISKFAELFILPFIRYKPKGVNIDDWLEYVFSVNNHPIKKYIVKNKFEIPGSMRIPPSKLVRGNRDFRTPVKESIAWVRYNQPKNRYDVEIKVNKKNRYEVFEMMPEEFNLIKKYLEKEEHSKQVKTITLKSWEEKIK